jgi:hypothetical protein
MVIGIDMVPLPEAPIHAFLLKPILVPELAFPTALVRDRMILVIKQGRIVVAHTRISYSEPCYLKMGVATFT